MYLILKDEEKLHRSLLTCSISFMTFGIFNEDISIQAKMLGFICHREVPVLYILGQVVQLFYRLVFKIGGFPNNVFL